MEHQPQKQEQAAVLQFTFTASKQDHPDITSSPTRTKHSLSTQRRGLNESGRERLKRHPSEVAGRVIIPDKWSQEEMLKDWLDFASFDALLAPKGFDLARAALVAERRQSSKEAMESNSKAYLGMHCSATRCIS